jgi:hypothetical protein
MMDSHRDQLVHWMEMVRPFHEQAGSDPGAAMAACLDYLVDNDALLECLSAMPGDVQARERNFMMNSVRGYWGYLDSLKARD